LRLFFFKEPAPVYLIRIQTGDAVQSQTNDNVEMIIRGMNGQISKILLKDFSTSQEKELFQRANLDEFEIEYESIGNVKHFRFQIF